MPSWCAQLVSVSAAAHTMQQGTTRCATRRSSTCHVDSPEAGLLATTGCCCERFCWLLVRTADSVNAHCTRCQPSLVVQPLLFVCSVALPHDHAITWATFNKLLLLGLLAPLEEATAAASGRKGGRNVAQHAARADRQRIAAARQVRQLRNVALWTLVSHCGPVPTRATSCVHAPRFAAAAAARLSCSGRCPSPGTWSAVVVSVKVTPCSNPRHRQCCFVSAGGAAVCSCRDAGGDTAAAAGRA